MNALVFGLKKYSEKIKQVRQNKIFVQLINIYTFKVDF